MAEAASAPVFGRRREAPAAPELDTSALYARLRTDALEVPDAPQAFDAWRRTRAPSRRLAWVASLGLMASGAVCLVLNAPAGLSAGLELAGLFGSAWLRRERRRHLAAIRDWDDAAPPDQGAGVAVGPTPLGPAS